MDQAEDLKAFERRMVEIVSSLQPSIRIWRFILFILILIASSTFYYIITALLFSSTSIVSDVNTENVSYFFRKEVYFSISICLLICAFFFGIHRKIFASNIIISRFRYILKDYNMSCDDKGRLIIKPRPSTIFKSL